MKFANIYIFFNKYRKPILNVVSKKKIGLGALNIVVNNRACIGVKQLLVYSTKTLQSLIFSYGPEY